MNVFGIIFFLMFFMLIVNYRVYVEFKFNVIKFPKPLSPKPSTSKFCVFGRRET